MIKNHYQKILSEIDLVLAKCDQSQIDLLIENIYKAQKIVLSGAGRVGFACRGFAMRLGHLGLQAYMLGDTTVPNTGKNDLLIVASGSGETQTVYDIATIAKSNGAHVVCITGNQDSRIGKLADSTVLIQAPSKTKRIAGFISSQPMTTLNEQCLQILFDSIVLEIMAKTKETHDTMWSRHSNLE